MQTIKTHAYFRAFLLALTLFGLLGYAVPAARAADTILVPTGATWKYLDNGTDQGTAWRATSFNDATWPSGPAQLGYGDGDEATTVGFGPNASNKFITTYFRRAFNVTNASLFTGVTLRLMRDDGAVVYLNGIEVWRTNMPTGSVGFLTPASVAIGGADESAFVQTTISPSLLLNGTNVLAIELHQSGGTSTDISFDLQLIGSDGSASVTRGPYLQIGTPNSTIVRWRTNVATNSRVSVGTTHGSLTTNTDDASLTTEHEVIVSNLSPATKYFYSVGSTTQTLAGNDANHYFVTAPVAGSTAQTRIWVLGDSGTANASAQAVRNAYLNFTGATHTNLWLMLGDNAYENGTDSEYQAAVFDMYPTTLRQSVLWPALGNHDTAQSSNPPASLPYFAMFTLPTAAQAGGIASGTEKYYSFDYANIHFICLDSMTSDRSANGPMATWLRADLSSTTRQWTIAFWHHPPYSKGSHDSDTDPILAQMRQNILPILEDAGVDLVLAGHSHSYERSYLIDGHYGTSSTFTAAMKKDGGSGRIDGSGAYNKPTLGAGTHEGAVYAVAGSSGQISGGTLNHPAMFISLNNLGSMVLDVNGNTLDAKFLRENGAIADYFRIVKGAVAPVIPAAPSSLVATTFSSSQINLTWTDNANNENGFKVEQSTDGTTFTQVAMLGSNATTYSATGLSASTTYFYRVASFNDAGNSQYSNTANATTSPAPPAVPAAPSGLTATPVSRTQINLSWADNSGNETGFKIERCKNANCTNYAEVAQVGANVTTFADTGLTKNTTYRYRVRAFNAGGNSGYSNAVSARTFK
ncbi:MAG TPA: fibronectin type III domain-containing protein [Pyrinomonadaceae bacterium]|nr:fibronectin type III domain-containing protein [Pyrinomonadaceae bacterium]